MRDTDRLRDLLEQAAPTQPDLHPSTRAAAVARRGRAARTRDRALIGAAAVAVVAVAVAVPTLGDGDGPDRATPAPPAVQVEPCQNSPMDTQDLDVVPEALGEVLAVRSCPVNGAAGDPLPDEPLVDEHAQAFGEDVAALPDYRLPPFCMVANVMQQPWALQVQQTDGDLITIGSTMRMCASVSIDGDLRGVGEVVAAFVGNLARQQSGGPAALACPTGDRLADGAETWNASFDPSTATAGLVCYRVDPMGAQEYAETEGTLDPDLLAVIRADISAGVRSESNGQMCTDTGPQRLVLLSDAEGDRVAFLDDRCSGEFAGPQGYWKPSFATEQAIAAALGGRVTG